MVHKLCNCYIVHVFEYFEDGERIYIVMEYCSGGSLIQALNKKIKKEERYTEK